MALHRNQSAKFDRLKKQAQALIETRPANAFGGSTDMLELIHQLRIYQAELEIQNDELRQAQQELSALHDQFAELYHFAPCGYVTLNPHGMITRINLAGVTLFGHDKVALEKMAFAGLLAPSSCAGYDAALRQAVNTAEKQTIELELKRKSESPQWVRADIQADIDDTGNHGQTRIILLDITAQKAAEAALVESERHLRRSQKMESIGTLAGGIAHEINNVLSIIIGNNELVMDELPRWGHARQYSEEIQSAGMRARDVVKQLLAFSRHDDAGRKPMRIDVVVRETMMLMRASITTHIDIRPSIADDVGAILGNATQINQLLINLINNAADAISGADGVISVDLGNATLDAHGAARRPPLTAGSYVKLVVRDNGAGIDPQIMDQIFDPYFTTKDVGKGTGIGLAVAHGIVQRHHGAITVESRPGKGAAFIVFFPIFTGDIQPQPRAQRTLPSGAERILFVDDELCLLKLGKKRLEKLGYDVAGATDPEEALDIFQSDPDRFDLVISDMAMPKMTGDQLARAILNIRPDMPVMLCTGYSEKMSEKTALEMGIRSFVMKPLDMKAFALSVRHALDEAKSESGRS